MEILLYVRIFNSLCLYGWQTKKSDKGEKNGES